MFPVVVYIHVKLTTTFQKVWVYVSVACDIIIKYVITGVYISTQNQQKLPLSLRCSFSLIWEEGLNFVPKQVENGNTATKMKSSEERERGDVKFYELIKSNICFFINIDINSSILTTM